MNKQAKKSVEVYPGKDEDDHLVNRFCFRKNLLTCHLLQEKTVCVGRGRAKVKITDVSGIVQKRVGRGRAVVNVPVGRGRSSSLQRYQFKTEQFTTGTNEKIQSSGKWVGRGSGALSSKRESDESVTEKMAVEDQFNDAGSVGTLSLHEDDEDEEICVNGRITNWADLPSPLDNDKNPWEKN
eukprot:m.26943 g.26943  ORF g.26943 m.26943 type:complete len:182 (+) comp29602_c0_seq1:54-599(+)